MIMKKVLIFAQIRDDEIEENTLGIINKIKQIFSDSEISATLIGYQLNDKWIQELGKHGIQKVYLVDTPETEVYLSRPYVKSMLEIIEAADPNLVIAAGTVYGEDLIPRLAIQNGVSCAQRILEHDTNAQILLISGYEEDGPDGIDQKTKKLIKGYLTKPIDILELSQLLDQVLT